MKKGEAGMKKQICLLLAALALFLFTGCTSSLQKDYLTAEELLEQGKYEESSLKFQELGSYEEASRLLMYCRATLAAENGD